MFENQRAKQHPISIIASLLVLFAIFGRGAVLAASPPVAVDDAVMTPREKTVTVAVLDNDTDPDGDTLSVSAFTQPQHGSVTCASDGDCTYSPAIGFTGTDRFLYTVTDGALSDRGRVAINVLPLCFGMTPTIVGTAGDDSLDGTNGNDVILGLAGKDHIDGKGGNDFVCGGPGNDTLIGGEGNDRLQGNSGDDHLSGSEGNDVILGDSGRDVLAGGPGMNALRGDDGSDAVDYTTATRGVIVNLATHTGTGDGSDSLAGIESVIGSAFDDVISGDGAGNSLSGNGGDDILDGAGGNDVLRGGVGDDVLAGGDGDDALNGGAGADRFAGGPGDDIMRGGRGADAVDYRSSTSGVTVDLAAATASGDGADTVRSITLVIGSQHDDHLAGDRFANTLRGLDGADQLTGSGGRDTLLGGPGDDTLSGGERRDFCGGGPGSDSADDSCEVTRSIP